MGVSWNNETNHIETHSSKSNSNKSSQTGKWFHRLIDCPVKFGAEEQHHWNNFFFFSQIDSGWNMMSIQVNLQKKSMVCKKQKKRKKKRFSFWKISLFVNAGIGTGGSAENLIHSNQVRAINVLLVIRQTHSFQQRQNLHSNTHTTTLHNMPGFGRQQESGRSFS